MRPRLPVFGRLTLRQLELLALVAPMAVLGAVYLLILGPVHPVFHSWPGFVVLAVALVAMMWVFTRVLFGAVRALQREVEALSSQTERHNQQLMLLHGADLALMRETRVDEAFRRIPILSVRLLGACHAAVVPRTPLGAGEPILAPEVAGPAAVRPCLVESVARDGYPLERLKPDSRLLTEAITHLGAPIATLYVTRAGSAPPFSEVDREVARMFATHAALVLENGRLHDEVRALAIEAERQAIAREMHDGMAQVLAFVNTKAQAVELYLGRGEVAVAREQMAELSAAARDVYADIRQGIGALRVQVVGKDLHTLLHEYARDFADATSVAVEVDWPDGETARLLSPEVEVHLFRIVQEALANVRRHSGARRVSIAVAVDGGQIDIAVRDDGHGFDPRAERDGRPRFGLQTMAERARALGGHLDVESAPEQGTQVRARVPLLTAGQRVG